MCMEEKYRRKFNSYNPTELLRMLEMRRGGMTYTAIATYYGNDHTTIVYHCKKHNVYPNCPVVRISTKKLPPVMIQKSEPKYALLIEEKINVGKSYKEYLNENRIKMLKRHKTG